MAPNYKFKVNLCNLLSGTCEDVEIETTSKVRSDIIDTVYRTYNEIMIVKKVTLIWEDDF